MHRLFGFLLVLLLVPTLLLAGAIREGSLTASSNGTSITVRWISEDEAGVTRYELERKAGTSGQFVLLVELQPRGGNQVYEYVDESAFLRLSETIYQYRVKVVYTGGDHVYYGPITVRHSVSSVRRTWGSIKAMFR